MVRLEAQPRLVRRPLLAAALLLVATSVTLLAAGCGGGSSSSTTSAPAGSSVPPAGEPTEPTGAPAGGDTTAAAADLGARVFEQRCVLCHGKAGVGDGTAAAALNPKPRNLRDAAYMSSRTDDQLLEIIRNGKGAMPAWGKNNALSEEEIQAVLKHIRSFTTPS
jgi:mono/diheme cytochrome c family protein